MLGRGGFFSRKGRVSAGTYDQEHEVFQNLFEMGVARDGNGAVDEGADKSPDEARDELRPLAHDLQAEGDAVDVRAVVGDDAEREDDEAELAEAAERREQDRGEQAADAAFRVPVRVRRVDRVHGRGGDREPEHLREAEREEQAGVGPDEGLDAGYVSGLVDGVVGRVARPAGAEAVDARGEGEDGSRFGGARVHGQVDEFARVRELAQHDEEDDEAGDPGPELVRVHDLVPEEGDEERRRGDDDDARVSGDIRVHGVEQLRADDDVDRRPSDAGEDVEEGDDFHAVEAEIEAREHHLTEPVGGPERGEEGDRGDGEHVDEEDGEEGVDEAELEDGDGQGADSEAGHDHVGGEPHGADFAQVRVCPFVFRHSLNASLLHAIAPHEPL